jgi:hypothetical protein
MIRRFAVLQDAKSRNKGVTAEVSVLTLKGRDPKQFEIASEARTMSSQIKTGYSHLAPSRWYSGAARQAAKAAVVLGMLALVIAMAAPATNRASADHAPLEAVFGTVVEVSLPDAITVATNSDVVRLMVPGNDVFTGDIGALEDVSEGDRVVASVHVEVDETTTIDRILVIPDLTKTVTRHILGVILDAEDGTISIQDRDGNTVTIDVPEGVTVPDIGTVVTAVAQLDRATGRLLAQAFDRVEDAVQRLQEATDRNEGSDLGDELEDRLEQARDQHLSALERAREALERARQAVEAAEAERMEAQRRLEEVQSKFDDLRDRYAQEATERNERQPELRTAGTMFYDEDAWAESEGTFKLTPRINDADGSVSREFAWNEETLAILPVEFSTIDGESLAVTTSTAQSVAVPLSEVKKLIPSGSQVTVQYDPNTEPPLTTLLTVLPLELSTEIEDALERERLHSISGFITLVEETPDLDIAIGVLVVANREHDVKVAAKITADTQIVIDGVEARFGQLAAGMPVEVEFSAVEVTEDSNTSFSIDGRLNALRVRARTVADENDVYVAGVIVGIDEDSRTIGILPRSGEVVRARVVEDAVIEKDGVQGRFGVLEVGDLVLDATRYNRDTLILTRLVVKSPRVITFSGTISGLDRNPNRLTVSTADGKALVTFVTADTRIQNEEGDLLEFSDLYVGERVLKGAVLPVARDGKTINVAQVLIVGPPKVSTARGVVSRVSSDAGEIRILVGAVSAANVDSRLLDLSVAENNRSLLFKNGQQIRNLSTVEPGDIVESVSFVTSSNVIVKMSVVSPRLHRVRGVVTDVSDAGLDIETSDGRKVTLTVNDETVITINGRRVKSLSESSVGLIVSEAVYVARADDLTRGLALRLVLVNQPVTSVSPTGSLPPPDTVDPDTPMIETTISGVIESMTRSSRTEEIWLIGDHKFRVTGDTELFGEEPDVGLVAKASLRLSDQGDFVATAISVAGRPDTNPSFRPVQVQPVEPGDEPDGDSPGTLVRVIGRVQELDESEEGEVVVVIDGVRIRIPDDSVIFGKAEVGAGVIAVVRRDESGDMTAARIVFTRPRPSSASNGDGGSTSIVVPAG